MAFLNVLKPALSPTSEYYDRDRPTFYKSIQSVRESGMDMSLQRDLKGMLDKELISSEGATSQLVYVLRN
ncbi:MAG: hypothetical protein KKA35_13245 [Proteobacteria bacterium]|nr:hypothetical protein [Pseudomonadota bacterium]